MWYNTRTAIARRAGVLVVLAWALACSDDDSGPTGGDQTGSIGGVVTSSGAGVPGATVTLAGDASGTRTTDGGGAYLFDDLDAGSYTVTLALPEGFDLGAGESASRDVTLSAGQTATINWTATSANPTQGTIAGTVTAGGQGVVGATITLGGAGTGTAATGATGTYSFTALDPGDYTVTIELPDGFELDAGEQATKPATVTAGQTTTVDWAAVEQGDNATIVTLSGTSFTPGNVTIAVGTTVRWVVSDGSHTITPDDPSQPGVWTDPGLISTGAQFEHTFTTAGVYDYHCQPHESLGMVGTITVQ